jgi:hypothetical protein
MSYYRRNSYQRRTYQSRSYTPQRTTQRGRFLFRNVRINGDRRRGTPPYLLIRRTKTRRENKQNGRRYYNIEYVSRDSTFPKTLTVWQQEITRYRLPENLGNYESVIFKYQNQYATQNAINYLQKLWYEEFKPQKTQEELLKEQFEMMLWQQQAQQRLQAQLPMAQQIMQGMQQWGQAVQPWVGMARSFIPSQYGGYARYGGYDR